MHEPCITGGAELLGTCLVGVVPEFMSGLTV
jgi:hypothetical protein